MYTRITKKEIKMFKKSIMILAICLMTFQPNFGMEMESDENLAPPGTKFETLKVFTEVRSTAKRFDQKQDENVYEIYKARAEEMDKKAAMLLEKSSRLETEADNLTNEAHRLANEARNCSRDIVIIQEAYKSAERAYKKAAQAHNTARITELVSAKIELAAAQNYR